MERSAHSNIGELYSMLKTTKNGLHTVRIARSRVQYGENILATGNENKLRERTYTLGPHQNLCIINERIAIKNIKGICRNFIRGKRSCDSIYGL